MVWKWYENGIEDAIERWEQAKRYANASKANWFERELRCKIYSLI
jgi:hypothetical protein